LEETTKDQKNTRRKREKRKKKDKRVKNSIMETSDREEKTQTAGY